MGGRTLEALEVVCSGADGAKILASNSRSPSPLEIDVLDGVTSLLDKSLTYQVEWAAGEPRYWMPETIQEYAREKLAEPAANDESEREAFERQHALYFMTLAEEAEPLLIGPRQMESLERLEADHDNFRAALKWSREHGEQGDNEATVIGLRIAGALWRFWTMHGYYSEGREQLRSLLACAERAGMTAPSSS